MNDPFDDVLIELRLADENTVEGRRISCAILLKVVAGLL